MISGSDKWIMRRMSRGGRLEKNDIGRRGSHGIGFAYEATHQRMVVLVTKIVHLGGRCIRACTGGNQRDTRYLKKFFNEREKAGGMMLQLMQDVNMMSLDKFQADILATRAQYEQSDAVLGGMGVGWTPSFLSTCYPRASRNLIVNFVKDIRKLSIGLILAL